MPIPIPGRSPEGRDRLRRQYQLEREWAQRLLTQPREARRRLYREVYNEFRLAVPTYREHCQEHRLRAPTTEVKLQAQLLEPFLSERALVVEIGSGDCALASYLAPLVGKVIAQEVCEEVLRGLRFPENLTPVLSAAHCLPLPSESVDLAYSCHMLEHLHPEDALEHMREVRRVLKPGSAYVCVTPNRLLGPHDISKYFDDEPSGLHLQEYSHDELARLFRESGFVKVGVLRGLGRPPTSWPVWLYALLEYPLSLSPIAVRRRILKLLGGQPPFRPLEQVKLVGQRPWEANEASSRKGLSP